MYSRTLIIALLALPLSGCDLPFGKSHPQWAIINRQKIQAAISETIKQKNPYPANLDTDFDNQQQENQRTSQQISDLRRSAMQACLGKSPNGQMKGGQPMPSPAMPLYGSSQMGSIPSEEAQACIQGIDRDQLIIDLKGKLQAFDKLQQQRRMHDIQVQKIMNDSIDSAIASYARASGLTLVISNEPSIVYNESKQVLDVTDGVIDRIQKPSPAQ